MRTLRVLALTAGLLRLCSGALFAAGTWSVEGAQLRSETLPAQYRIEFRAVEPRGLAIVFAHHGAKDFCALRLGPEGATLAEVREGSVRVLAERLPAAAEGAIFVRPGHVLIAMGRAVRAAPIAAAEGGRYGAAPGSGGRFERLVLRPEEPIYFTDGFMRTDSTGEHWHPLAGNWSIRHERDVTRSANPFRCIARSTGVGLMATGEPYWHEYSISANICAPSGSAGLAFGVEDVRNYLAFILGVEEGTSRLVRVRDGRETVLASTDRVLARNRWFHVAVRSDGAGTVCSVDGVPLLRAPELIGIGMAGLVVNDAQETLFDDVLIASTHLARREKPLIELFSQVFETDAQTENWASLWSAWHPQLVSERGKPARNIYWHKGDFFGDVSIGYRLAEPPKGAWTVLLFVGADREEAARAATLTIAGADKGCTWTLSASGKPPVSAEAAVPADALISLAREGERLVARAGDKVVLDVPQAAPTGCRIGLSFVGARVDLHKVEIRSDNVHDYLFEEAPVEWFPRTGTWEITNRWVCDPRWSWLGGQSRQVAQMWTKRAFYGDQTIEFFAAFKMQEGTRYPHVGDINLTFCGDGENLASGYQVIYAGWGNRWTRLLRNGEVVAGSADAIIRGEFHRRWFHIKVRKTGDLVQLYIDDELVRQFRDPNPLEGGQIALWTVDNGIMIARVRCYAERSELRSYLKKAVPKRELPAGNPTPPPAGYLVLDEFKQGVGRWANRDGEQGATLDLVPGGGLMLTNENCGGSFGATMYDLPVDLLRYPVIRLEYKIVSPDPVRLNLFARVGGELFELPLTAPPAPEVAATLSGGPTVAFHGKPDGRVRVAEIDLGSILTARHEQRFGRKPLALVATELYLANASNEKYLLCGFGGNATGARLQVVSFAIKTRERGQAN